MENFGEKLKRLMFEFNVTQEDLAKKLNLDQSYISKLKLSKRTPSLKTLKQFANFFKVPVNFFVENSNNTQSGNNNIIGNRNITNATDNEIKLKLIVLTNMFCDKDTVFKIVTSKNKDISSLNNRNSTLINAKANMLIENFEIIPVEEFNKRFKQKVSNAKKVFLGLCSNKIATNKKGFMSEGE